jgi:F-type H+-transporting ATPase subunit delta
VISSAIFVRYAHALADVALQEGDEAVTRENLSAYREIFRQVPELIESLDSPAVQRDAKDRLLQQLAARYPVVPMVGNFLRILLDHHRIRYYSEIFDAYIKTVDDRKGIVAARVAAASPLSDKNQMALRESLGKATGKEVHLTVEIDPDLLAGVVVQIGSTVYDGSIRTQLQEMRRRLEQE